MDIRLTKALARFNAFLDQLSKHHSEPVRKTEKEVQQIIQRLEEGSFLGDQFYIVASTLSIELPYHVHALKYLPVQKGFFNANTYIELIHPAYFEEYLEWGIACYAYIDYKSKKHELEPIQISFRMNFPIKLKDGKYYWTRMEVFPLQLDKNDNMITHLNFYMVMQLFDEKEERKPLIGEIWDNNFTHEVWTRELKKEKICRSFFILTPIERRIIDILFLNVNYRNEDVANALNKKKNNIEKHNKNILAKARESFPHLVISNVKELAQFLNNHGYFDGSKEEPPLSKW